MPLEPSDEIDALNQKFHILLYSLNVYLMHAPYDIIFKSKNNRYILFNDRKHYYDNKIKKDSVKNQR